METKKKGAVLVATDFSEVAESAIENAVGFAKVLDLKVYYLHVITKHTRQWLKKENLSEEAITQKLQALVDAGSKNHNLEGEFIVKEGDLFTTIADVVKETGVNIMFLGTRGKTGVEYITGQWTQKIIATCNIPGIVTQSGKFGNGYDVIVLPIDETPESKQKVKWALFMAKIFNTTFHIIGPNRSDQFLANKVKSTINQIKLIFEQNKIPYTIKMVDTKGGSFRKIVIQYAVEMKADLTIMMVDNENAISSFLGGFLSGSSSDDEQLIKDAANISTMLVNPQDFRNVIGGL